MEMTTTTSAGWPCKGTDKGGGCCDAGVEPDSDLADPVTKKNMREIGSLPGDLEVCSTSCTKTGTRLQGLKQESMSEKTSAWSTETRPSGRSSGTTF
jgi:hypothetical protein